MQYSKPPLSFKDQLQLLENRGMVVTDHNEAEHYLSHLNYYRLAAYFLPYEANHRTHQFRAETTFSEILNLYIFDRELRLLVLDAIERVEVSIRTQFAYCLSHTYGPHAHLDATIFKRKWNHGANQVKLEREVKRSREGFIQHLRTKYDEPLPPIWAVVEVMSFGQLSSWYSNLSSGVDRNKVARIYQLDETNLVSFLHHLSIIRNYCAHHSRLWNREFNLAFKLPRNRPQDLVTQFNTQTHSARRIYNSLVMLAHLLDLISPNHKWKQRLITLVNVHNVDTEPMGFPNNWQKLPIWR